MPQLSDSTYSEQKEKHVECFSAMEYLLREGMVWYNPCTSAYEATRLGVAAASSGLSPSAGADVYDAIKQCLGPIVLEGDLHLCYAMATQHHQYFYEVNWLLLKRLMRTLSRSERRAICCLSIDTEVIESAAEAGNLPSSLRGTTVERRCMRLQAALLILGLLRDYDIDRLCASFNVTRGLLQSLQQNCSIHAQMASKFCDHLGHWAMAALFEDFHKRLKLGAHRDLQSVLAIGSIPPKLVR
eukprot:Polyplicarium_translucidae@DN2344_c0_g1_i4.p1